MRRARDDGSPGVGVGDTDAWLPGHRALVARAALDDWLEPRLTLSWYRSADYGRRRCCAMVSSHAAIYWWTRPAGRSVVVNWDTALHGPAHIDCHTLVQNLRWWAIAPWVPRRLVVRWWQSLERAYVRTVEPEADAFRAAGVFSLVKLLTLTREWRR